MRSRRPLDARSIKSTSQFVRSTTRTLRRAPPPRAGGVGVGRAVHRMLRNGHRDDRRPGVPHFRYRYRIRNAAAAGCGRHVSPGQSDFGSCSIGAACACRCRSRSPRTRTRSTTCEATNDATACRSTPSSGCRSVSSQFQTLHVPLPATNPIQNCHCHCHLLLRPTRHRQASPWQPRSKIKPQLLSFCCESARRACRFNSTLNACQQSPRPRRTPCTCSW
jgi:hypothetical protein